ncbi:MAG: hypothetical protein VYA34_00910 [Myxococcota bacterium]|nr:hypothetical protein [Myxococcota bacterium]
MADMCTEYPSLRERTQLVDQVGLRTQLRERFGFSDQDLSGLTFFQSNKRLVSVIDKQHEPEGVDAIQTMGIPFVHANMVIPKLSSAAVFLLGARAKKNVIELHRVQVETFMTRQPITLKADGLSGCMGNGYVLVRHQGYTIGVGMIRFSEQLNEAELESYFPKVWASKSETVFPC